MALIVAIVHNYTYLFVYNHLFAQLYDIKVWFGLVCFMAYQPSWVI